MAPLVPATVAKWRRAFTVLWAALFTAVPLYGLVIVLTENWQPGLTVPYLQPILSSIALVLAAAAVVVHRSFVASVTSSSVLPTSAAPTAEAAVLRYQRLMTYGLMAWLCSDAIAIFGLVLGLLARSVRPYLPFAFGAAVLFLVHRPAAWALDRCFNELSQTGGAS